MELGLFGVNYGTCGDPDAAIRVVQHAEAAGLESVWSRGALRPAEPGGA
jgi:hypothetical protein